MERSLFAVNTQTTFFPRSKANVVSFSMARIDEVKFVTIRVHRSKPLSVYERTETVDVLGEMHRRSSQLTQRRNPDGEGAKPSSPPPLAACS